MFFFQQTNLDPNNFFKPECLSSTFSQETCKEIKDPPPVKKELCN